MQVVLTRARADAEASAARLGARGVATILLPVTRLVVAVLPPLPAVDFVVATSRHAFAGLPARPAPERAAVLARPLYAVGAATAAAARAAGFLDVRVAAGDADALVDLLVLSNASGRALYLAGADRKPRLETALAERSIETHVVLAYAAAPRVWEAADRTLAADAARAGAHVLHYSRRGADLFVKQLDAAGLAGRLDAFRHLALSKDAGAPIRDRGAPVICSVRPDEDDLFALLAP